MFNIPAKKLIILLAVFCQPCQNVLALEVGGVNLEGGFRWDVGVDGA